MDVKDKFGRLLEGFEEEFIVAEPGRPDEQVCRFLDEISGNGSIWDNLIRAWFLR